jgi:sigma-B regulation protein RsbU (phosphoserine phosphatase)
MTIFFSVLDPATGRLEYVSAGHPYPMLRRRDGMISELGSGGLPLGIRDELECPTGEVVIDRGDTLLLFTDGVVETLDPSGADYGYERLRGSFAHGGTASAVHDRIVREMEAFQADAAAHDDRSLVVLSRRIDLPPVPDKR